MSDFFWFSDEQWARIEPLRPTDTRGMARVDDRRVQWGIIHALKNGGRWTGCPHEVYGPKKTLYNRFVRWAELGVAELMDASEEDVLAYMASLKEPWSPIYLTNPLDRLNGEITQRTNAVGIFPNDAAIIRLVGALLLEQNDEWALTRRFMSLESLAWIVDNPALSLPRLARRGQLSPSPQPRRRARITPSDRTPPLAE